MKRVLQALLGLVAVAVAAVVLLLENPDSYRGQLLAALESATGYEVRIDGALSWRYWPPVALRAGEVSVALPGKPQLAQMESLALDMNLLSLLIGDGAVDIREIELLSGQARLVADGAGGGNWMLAEAPQTGPVGQVDGSENGSGAGGRGAGGSKDGSASGSGAGGSKEGSASGSGTGGGESVGSAGGSGAGDGDAGGGALPLVSRLNVRDFSLAYEAPGEEPLTVRIESLEVSNLGLGRRGSLSFALAFGDGGRRLAGQVAIAGNAKGLRLDGLDARLDGSRLEGRLYLGFPPQGAIDADLRLEGLNLAAGEAGADAEAEGKAGAESEASAAGAESTEGAESAESEASAESTVGKASAEGAVRTEGVASAESIDSKASAASAKSGADLQLIPVDLLRQYAVKLLVRIGALQLPAWELHEVKLEASGNRQQVEALVSAKGMDGKLVASVSADLAPGTAEGTAGEAASSMTLTLDSVQASDFIGADGLEGRLQGSAELSLKGSRLSQIADSIKGKSSFSIKDGKLDVRPIKRMSLAIDAITGERSSVSDWPDALPFSLMTGDHYLAGGTQTGQTFNAQVDGISLTGQGGFDLASRQLDYDITVIFAAKAEGAFKVSDQLAGTRWPIRCKGQMTASAFDLCLGNEARIARTVKDLLKQRARERLSERLEDKVPERLKDRARGLFDKLLK